MRGLRPAFGKAKKNPYEQTHYKISKGSHIGCILGLQASAITSAIRPIVMPNVGPLRHAFGCIGTGH